MRKHLLPDRGPGTQDDQVSLNAPSVIKPSSSASRSTGRGRHLGPEQLEDRRTPASAATYDALADHALDIRGNVHDAMGGVTGMKTMLENDQNRTPLDGDLLRTFDTSFAGLQAHAALLQDRDGTADALAGVARELATLGLNATKAADALRDAEVIVQDYRHQAAEKGKEIAAVDPLLTQLKIRQAALATEITTIERQWKEVNAKIAATRPATPAQQRTLSQLRTAIAQNEKKLFTAKPAQKAVIEKDLDRDRTSLKKIDVWSPLTSQKTILNTRLQTLKKEQDANARSILNATRFREDAVAAQETLQSALTTAEKNVSTLTTDAALAADALTEAQRREQAAASALASLQERLQALPDPEEQVRLALSVAAPDRMSATPLAGADAIRALFATLSREVREEEDRLVALALAQEKERQAAALALAQEQERQAAAALALAQEQEREAAAALALAQEKEREIAAALALAQEQEREAAALALAQEQEREAAAALAAAQEQERANAAAALAAEVPSPEPAVNPATASPAETEPAPVAAEVQVPAVEETTPAVSPAVSSSAPTEEIPVAADPLPAPNAVIPQNADAESGAVSPADPAPVTTEPAAPVSAASQETPAVSPSSALPAEVIPAVTAVLTAEQLQLAERLSAFRNAIRMSGALAIPLYEYAISEAENRVVQRQLSLTEAQNQRPYRSNDAEVEQAKRNLQSAIDTLNGLRNSLQGARAAIATDAEALPVEPVLQVLGVNHNKIVLQVAGADPSGGSINILHSSNYGIRALGEFFPVTVEGHPFPVFVIPFHGNMDGTVGMTSTQPYSLMFAHGDRRQTLEVRWSPQDRKINLQYGSFPAFGSVTNPETPAPQADVLQQWKDVSDTQAASIAPHREPASFANTEVARNVPATVWGRTGLPDIADVSFLEESKKLLIQQRYAVQLADGWRPGDTTADQIWQELCGAAERLKQAAHDYFNGLLREQAGYDVPAFDLSRFENSYPNFPTGTQIRTAIDTRFLHIFNGVLDRANEDAARSAALERARNIVPVNTEPTGVSDAAFNRTVDTIVAGHRNDEDGGAVQLNNYALSVGRTLTTTEIALKIGRPVQVVLVAIAPNTNPAMGWSEVLNEVNVINESPLITAATPRDLGKIETFDTGANPFSVQLKPNETTSVKFELTKEAFLNGWMENLPAGMKFSLNQEGLGTKFDSQRSGGEGVSMSARLEPGKYALFMEAGSPEIVSSILPAGGTVMHPRSPNVDGTFPFDLNFKLSMPSQTSIEGMVSREGSGEVFPVSIRIASFDAKTGDRIVDYADSSFPKIDPKKQTWIVVHGMNSMEQEAKMENLARELYKSGVQTITVNWQQAAVDPWLPLGSDSPWTVPVGQWVARRVIDMGFDPSLLNGAGHSHGTYVLHSMAKEIKSQKDNVINSLVALDAAGNSAIYNQFNHYQINFKEVAKYSLAFEASMIADSNRLADSAHAAFQIRVAGTGGIVDTSRLHGAGLTMFAEILRHERETPGDFSNHFSLQKIMTQECQDLPYKDEVGGSFAHGLINADFVLGDPTADGKNNSYYQAIPSSLYFVKIGELEPTIISFDKEQ